MNYSFSLHKIHEKESCPFDEAAYSYFKFGETKFAEAFALELFNGFIEQYAALILAHPEIVILPSPYHSIPTASNFLCSFFKKQLNYFLFQNGKNACVESKISRLQTYTEDYGNMDYEQRINLISNDTYYLDRNFIQGKLCIFLDDIKITGSHERTVKKILKDADVIGDFIFLYYAELANKTIHPNIENHYNYFAVKDLGEIISVMNSNSFQFNTRIVKYALMLEDSKFQLLLQSIAQSRAVQMLEMAISNNYHQIEAYQSNIKTLNNSELWQSTSKKGNGKTSMLQNSPSV